MKIKASHSECISFLHEIIDDYGEAASWYGMSLGTENEERAGQDYDTAWHKVQVAMKLVFKGNMETA